MNLFKFKKNKNSKSFIETQNFLSSIDSINYGGCGIAALALYDAAVREGKKVEIVYLYNEWNTEEMEINEQFQQGNNTKAASCMHIVVKVDGEKVDCDGNINLKFLPVYKEHTVTREHLIQSLITGGWNPCFDRRRWFHKIKEFCQLDVDLPIKINNYCYYEW